MDALFLQNVILEQQLCDVLIEGHRFAQIAPRLPVPAEAKILDCRGELALSPPFYNLHSHAAMTLLRGYADDMELFTWLQQYIWPAEAQLTPEDVYWGTKLAGLEMIRSGTVFVNDMYWHATASLEAFEEMGLRAALGYMYICVPGGGILESNIRANDEMRERSANLSRRIRLTHAPHAIYTVEEKTLREIAEQAAEEQAVLHIHAAETLQELADCQKQHGLSPIAYLDKLGLLGPKTVLAHCTHLSDEDIGIISERRAVIAHNPISNQKLVSGLFRFQDALAAGCRIGIGTDGCASNNNLSMFDEMKSAALSAKVQSRQPTAGKDCEIYACATKGGCEIFDFEGGQIAPGKLADAVLLKLSHPAMLGDYNLISNLVYAADSSVVDTVICDGRILLEHGCFEGEEEIIQRCRQICRRLRPGREKMP